jgi:DNA-binding PadR family transcriptional regulator
VDANNNGVTINVSKAIEPTTLECKRVYPMLPQLEKDGYIRTTRLGGGVRIRVRLNVNALRVWGLM